MTIINIRQVSLPDGKGGPQRPKMTGKQLTERDCREWKFLAINPHDRHTWRSDVRPAMHAASQLPGRGTMMWMLPLYLHVNQKSDDDDDVGCPYVRLSVLHPSVHIFRFRMITWVNVNWIFTKLCVCIDLVEVWFGIANGQIPSSFNRV